MKEKQIEKLCTVKKLKIEIRKRQNYEQNETKNKRKSIKLFCGVKVLTAERIYGIVREREEKCEGKRAG